MAPLAPVATVMKQFVYIRVRQALLLPIQSSPTNPSPASAPPTGHLYLIEGEFEHIQRYAEATVDWLIRVAHLICDPCGAGHLYTHTAGTSSDWYHLDRTPNWRQVALGDPLLPGIYEFESTTPILLSKISERNNHSITTPGSESSSKTFRRCLELREGARCAVTRTGNALVASHLIPKRMGSDGVKAAVTRFSGEAAAHDIQRFDPRIGILLYGSLDVLVDHYQFGFYHVTGNTYVLHNFNDPDLSVLGIGRLPLYNNAPPLHLFSITLSVHAGDTPLPPKGTFNWHYLQCVIHAFGTPNYRNFLNISYLVLPFKTASDELDDEYTDNDDMEPPYPSYRFDQYLAEQGKRQLIRERNAEVACWSSGIPSISSAPLIITTTVPAINYPKS